MTVPMDAIQNMADMLYRKGDVCNFGVDESSLETKIDAALARYPNKKIRAVKNWVWWDLDVSAEACSQYEACGVQPAIIYSTYLIWDSSGQWTEGWNVKTTPLASFEENCFFITRNTVYILVGQGHRKTVDPQLAASLYF